MLVVVALGGNALLRRGEPPDAATQRRNIGVAAQAVADIAAAHKVVVTHGNGPQVGLLALQAEAYKGVQPYTLDLLGAETEGLIGYLIEQELANRMPGREVCTLLTQVVVDPDDPAFRHPSKPIGPVYEEPEARTLAIERGWHVGPDGAGFRRLVPSPRPRRVIELNTIRMLVWGGVVVVCAGGGGIPVIKSGEGAVRGVEAVIDKDLSAALLGRELGADALLLLTDVEAVYTDWEGARLEAVREATPDRLADYRFAPGSMAPKVAAARSFVEASGGVAGIGRLDDGVAILEGRAGTHIRPGNGVLAWYPRTGDAGA